jgi:hypothetical protein
MFRTNKKHSCSPDLFSAWACSCFPFTLHTNRSKQTKRNSIAFSLFTTTVISLPVGPHPEWVKPAAEGGRLFFLFYFFGFSLFLVFQVLRYCFVFATIYFVQIAFRADGRESGLIK